MDILSCPGDGQKLLKGTESLPFPSEPSLEILERTESSHAQSTILTSQKSAEQPVSCNVRISDTTLLGLDVSHIGQGIITPFFLKRAGNLQVYF